MKLYLPVIVMASGNSCAHQISSKPRGLLKWKNMSRVVVAKEKFEYCYRGRNLKKSGTSARYVQAYTIETVQTHHISPFTLTFLLTTVYLCFTLILPICYVCF